jgi:hypothetical protein
MPTLLRVTFRFRHRTVGVHVHLRLFAGSSATLGNCGSLVMRKAEFEAFKRLLDSTPEAADVWHEFICDDDEPPVLLRPKVPPPETRGDL